MTLEYMILFFGFIISEIMVGCQTMQDLSLIHI